MRCSVFNWRDKISLELRDLRAKVTVEAECALDAYAIAHEMDKSEVVREVIQRWAIKQIHATTVMARYLKREGLDRVIEGMARCPDVAPPHTKPAQGGEGGQGGDGGDGTKGPKGAKGDKGASG